MFVIYSHNTNLLRVPIPVVPIVQFLTNVAFFIAVNKLVISHKCLLKHIFETVNYKFETCVFSIKKLPQRIFIVPIIFVLFLFFRKKSNRVK